MIRPDAVLFDCDGVIVDSEGPTFDLLVADLSTHGLPLTRHRLETEFIGGTIETVAQRATAEQVAHLRRLTDAMDAACAKSDTRRFQDLNIEFHAALVEAARNRRLQEVYQGLSKESRLFRRRALVSKAAMKASNQEHRAIVEAVAQHDAMRAAAAMENHILRGKERFMSAASDELED